MDVNDALALGTLSTGTGYSMVNELFSGQNTYQRHHENVAELIHKISWATIEESGKEEAELARELGQACIIGERTRKILFLGVRNAYCCICARVEKKGMPIPEHKCFKNWSKTSTSMEADIIVEGWRQQCFQKIVRGTYGNKLVEKIECRNHLLRNFCKKIRDICARCEAAAVSFNARGDYYSLMGSSSGSSNLSAFTKKFADRAKKQRQTYIPCAKRRKISKKLALPDEDYGPDAI
ncbi:hypothetical protein NQ314_005112 [Rhamnusium bicolor]|uniref:Mutator-like transposase domain-containing protein n=1 Tax=Rhamnusium bicolor TaxID=1586634 RepID=A0AAV8ZIX2_9CUCU|nr:hypothetical protein NQ314_005112 [Rhamnusium bicolor]